MRFLSFFAIAVGNPKHGPDQGHSKAQSHEIHLVLAQRSSGNRRF
ncbi:MAG: hypothetical protein ACI9KK_003124, partial [Ascidiaceihabitans sp.]